MERKKQDGKCFEINVREYRKGNQKQTMQRNWHHRELNVTKKSLKIPKGGNQNLYIEEEQTTQWPKEKVQKDKQRSTKHAHTKQTITQMLKVNKYS